MKDFDIIARIAKQLDDNHFIVELPRSQSKKIRIDNLYKLLEE